MDFFKELLESFSRVKGRKIRLLEQDGDFSSRLNAANKIVADALATGKTSVTGFDGLGATKPINIGLTTDEKKVKVQNRYLYWNGQTMSKPEKEADLKGAVTNLVGPEDSQKNKSSKKEKNPEELKKQKEEAARIKEEKDRQDRRQSVLRSDMAKKNPKIVDELVSNIDEFDQAVTNLLCTEDGSINPDYMDQIQFD